VESFGTILGLCVNAAVAVLLALLRGAMKRVADDLDRRLKQQDDKLAKVEAAVDAEKDARHQATAAAGDRLWQVNADLKENYPSRRETMKQYGTLCQNISKLGEELGRKIDELPCHQVACPVPKQGDAS